jgi:hypothetical protein
MAPKVQADYDDETRPSAKVFQETHDDLNVDGFTFTELKEIASKGSFVAAILQPRLWFISGKYGVTWKVIQMKVHAKKTFGKPTSYAFSDNTSDSEQPTSPQPTSTQPTSNVEDSVEDSDDEEDEESSEEEEESTA